MIWLLVITFIGYEVLKSVAIERKIKQEEKERLQRSREAFRTLRKQELRERLDIYWKGWRMDGRADKERLYLTNRIWMMQEGKE